MTLGPVLVTVLLPRTAKSSAVPSVCASAVLSAAPARPKAVAIAAAASGFPAFFDPRRGAIRPLGLLPALAGWLAFGPEFWLSIGCTANSPKDQNNL
jgi:hypothetical protein